MKIKKTTQKQFKEFKEEFLKWQKRLGLIQYEVNFSVKYMPNSFARIETDNDGMCAMVYFTSEVGLSNDTFDFCPKNSARHEAFHLLISRMAYLARCRFVTQYSIDEEDESTVRRLEHAFDEVSKNYK